MLQCCNVAACTKAMLQCCMCSTRGVRRAKFDVPIFTGDPPPRLPSMLKEWKDEYRVRMRPEALQIAEGMSNQKWHQYLRKAFRSHLFQFVGRYEMTVCFLIAPLARSPPGVRPVPARCPPAPRPVPARCPPGARPVFFYRWLSFGFPCAFFHRLFRVPSAFLKLS